MSGWPGARSLDGGLDRVPLPPPVPGTLWLCGKRVVAPDPDAALARADADTIVCLNERHELERDHPYYPAWLEAADERALWWPVPDLGAPTRAEATAMVDELEARVRAGRGLVVHCAGGIGRAPTLAVCLLIRLGHTAESAQEHVARHRPTAGPEAGPQRELVAAFAGTDGAR